MMDKGRYQFQAVFLINGTSVECLELLPTPALVILSRLDRINTIAAKSTRKIPRRRSENFDPLPPGSMSNRKTCNSGSACAGAIPQAAAATDANYRPAVPASWRRAKQVPPIGLPTRVRSGQRSYVSIHGKNAVTDQQLWPCVAQYRGDLAGAGPRADADNDGAATFHGDEQQVDSRGVAVPHRDSITSGNADTG